ncbi:hypothetical protein [Cohnella abietis]|uniref:Uncharacterized protein n=1 Tax=Cohnella abietis TaxID=2507935 RepID=A0A3T1D246_9BACL|nr:hypothetical protein [Cohnella abietis]BBI32166.1 hypothetical protein KCTCHS21_15650 [Cohnella abietis]
MEEFRRAERLQNLISSIRSRKIPSPLTPEHSWLPALDEEIAAISEAQLAQGYPDGVLSAQAWKAALYLWNDSLDAAHKLVEHLETPTGAALHGMMHRREGDFDNAQYWFHRAGHHPAFHTLQSRATDFLSKQFIPRVPMAEVFHQIASQGSWNPYLFNNAIAIQENRIGGEETRTLLEHLQQLELDAFIRFLEGRIALSTFSFSMS